jgi:hypothetical protein
MLPILLTIITINVLWKYLWKSLKALSDDAFELRALGLMRLNYFWCGQIAPTAVL